MLGKIRLPYFQVALYWPRIALHLSVSAEDLALLYQLEDKHGTTMKLKTIEFIFIFLPCTMMPEDFCSENDLLSNV